MSRPDPLQLWDDVAQDTLAVVRELDGEEWQLPTALPGWDVRDVVAHLAHLESEAAGMPQPDGGGADQVEATGAMPTSLTQAGVDARRDASGEELRAELEQACTTRREVLADLDTSDLSAPAPGLVGALGWDLRTWLRNRPVDLWVHATDLRRATGRTVRTDETGATHVARMLTGAFPFALRRLPPGTSVVAEITGPQGRTLAAQVGDDGRAAPVDPPAEPTVHLAMDDVTWLVLGSGREDPAGAAVTITGDAALAQQVLGQLNVMP